MISSCSAPFDRPFGLSRRRRAFGLDAPRPPDLRRTEAAILAWLEVHAPSVRALHVEEAGPAMSIGTASTLVLLLPAGRVAVLRIDIEATRCGARTLALAEECRTRRIPLAVVAEIDQVRAVLRRLGIEAEDR